MPLRITYRNQNRRNSQGNRNKMVQAREMELDKGKAVRAQAQAREMELDRAAVAALIKAKVLIRALAREGDRVKIPIPILTR